MNEKEIIDIEISESNCVNYINNYVHKMKKEGWEIQAIHHFNSRTGLTTTLMHRVTFIKYAK